jgi:hypothetical protein
VGVASQGRVQAVAKEGKPDVTLPDRGGILTTSQKGWTRDTFEGSTTYIRIKAIGVWDTVGALGIPPVPLFGIRGSAEQWKL